MPPTVADDDKFEYAGEYSGKGRPSLLATLGITREVGEQLRLYARRMVLAHNRTRRSGSYSLALRLAAENPISPAAFRAWVAARKDRNAIPPILRAWLDVPAAVQRHHRAPEETALSGLYVPQSLRVSFRTGERLRAGERFSADDGSVNFLVYVPWKWEGDPCSEKYGVRVGRYQLLVMHDDGSGYVPHFSWIARASDSYRAEDIATFLHQPFAQLGLWDSALLEQASWKSHRVTELLALAGVERETAYERQQKPVENWWNRAWTLLSTLPGQIGRYRGEQEEMQRQLDRFRRGTEDPRKHLLSLTDAAAAVARVIARLNSTRIVSSDPLFGSWVPAERWAADLAARPLRRLAASVEPMTRPERRKLMVRKYSVHPTAWCPHAACPLNYQFYAEELIGYEGKYVLAYFDPLEEQVTAAIYTIDGKKLITARATCIKRQPALVREGDGYRFDWDDGQLERGRAAKAASRAAVRREHRTLAPDGKIEAWSTEVRDAMDRSVASVSRTPGGTAADPQSATTPAESAPALSRNSQTNRSPDSARGGSSSPAPARPDPTDEDLAELERLERRAQERGLIPQSGYPL